MCTKFLRPLLGIAGALLLATAPSYGQIYNEIGDAGQTLGGAQSTGVVSGNSLTTIFGTLSGQNDADLFVFMITAPTTFSASTMNTLTMTSGLDTALFLFNSMGVPIYTNDDANGTTVQSTLPAGTSFTMTLSPGTYYLGISLTGNEPMNSNGQLLFAPFPGGNSTAVRGPASGLNPNTLANFTSGSFAQTGGYQIDLTSSATSAVPEPSTTALVAASVAGLFLVWKRRQVKSAS